MSSNSINVIIVFFPGSAVEGVPEDPDPTGPRVGEEVLRQARRLHRPEEDPAQADQKDQQVEAEET